MFYLIFTHNVMQVLLTLFLIHFICLFTMMNYEVGCIHIAPECARVTNIFIN